MHVKQHPVTEDVTHQACLDLAGTSLACHLCAGSLQTWVQDYLRKGLQWAQAHAPAVSMPVMGILQNTLSHLEGAANKRQFACGLARGLGANLDPALREQLAAEISRWCGESKLLEPTGDIASMIRSALVQVSMSCMYSRQQTVPSAAGTYGLHEHWHVKSPYLERAGCQVHNLSLHK